MKKVLFASTALVAFAGAAAADITLSGSAEMGIAGGDVLDKTQFFQDVDVRFTMEAESDSGLTFGAVVDLDEAGGLTNSTDDNGTYVYISGSFGNLTMGDTDGALDWALKEAGNVGNPGSIADDETSHVGYLGSYGDGGAGGAGYDGQILRYDGTFGQFGVAVSFEQGASGAGGLVVAGDHSGSVAIGLKYAFDFGATTLNLGLGYQQTDFSTADDQGIIGVSVDAAFGGGFSAGLQYSNWSDVGGAAGADDWHVGLGLGYEANAISIHANYGKFDSGNKGFGLAAAYDLGGGLSANLGYGNSKSGGTSSNTWSLGMVMSF